MTDGGANDKRGAADGGTADAANGDAIVEFEHVSTQFWSSAGMSRAAGQILSHLMVCEPAQQTQAQIAQALDLSSGTVSTQLRTLVATTLVEQVSQRGTRAHFYQLPEDVWLKLMGSEQSRIGALRVIADAGAKVTPATRADRIGSLDLIVRFFEEEWPVFMQRYDEFLRKERP